MTALVLIGIEIFYYVVKKVPIADNIIDYLIGMALAIVIIGLCFRYIKRLIIQLQHEIHEHRKTEIALLDAYAKLGITVEKQVREIKSTSVDLQFLSKAAIEFAELKPDDNIYHIIGKKLKELTGDSIVFISLYDEKTNRVFPQELVGLEGFFEAVAKVMQGNPLGKSYVLSDLAKQELLWARLTELPNGIYSMSPEIPSVICSALEKLLSIGSVYGIGLTREGKLLGNVGILMRHGAVITNKSTIEVFVSHASVVLQRKHAEDELKKYTVQLEEIVENRTKELRKSEEKFSKAFKASPEAITIASMENGRYIEVNEVFLKKTGFKRDEVIDHTSAELGVWVEANERQAYIEELSKNGYLRNFEARFLMRSGEVRYFLVSSEIIELDENRCHLSFIVDITERKQAEQEKELLIRELKVALSQVKKLSGLLPICASCKKIRDDQGYWKEIEKYIKEHSEADFSHGMCPDCAEKLYPNLYQKIKERLEFKDKT